LIPVRVKGLTPDRDFRFHPHFTSQTSYLAMHGLFPEAIIDSKTSAIAYYNNSDTRIRIPCNVTVGEVSDWNSTDWMVSEQPEIVNSFFSVASLVPSLAFAMNSGISALQCAQVTYQPGTELHATASNLSSTTADPFVLTPPALSPPTFTKDAVDIYSLLPPLDERNDNNAKFGSQAIHVNTADRITAEQIGDIKHALQEFPSLWEDRVGRIIQPESD
jgi:hypothetical protein